MQLTITNLGKFRLSTKLREMPIDRFAGPIRNRISRKIDLPHEAFVDLGGGRMSLKPSIFYERSAIDLEEAEVDLLLVLFSGVGWIQVDDNDDVSPDGHPFGWVLDLEAQIKQHRDREQATKVVEKPTSIASAKRKA